MPPQRNSNAARKSPADLPQSTPESKDQEYSGLVKALKAMSVSHIVFLPRYDVRNPDHFMYYEVVPMNEEREGRGMFYLSIEEFNEAQKQFPGINFINKKDTPPTPAEVAASKFKGVTEEDQPQQKDVPYHETLKAEVRDIRTIMRALDIRLDEISSILERAAK